LHTKGFVGGAEAGSEDEICFIGGTEISCQEIGKDGSGGIEGCGVGFVLGVPFVFDFGELLGGVFGTEGEMALCVVGFSFYTRGKQSEERHAA